jgi:sugar-specific transcriptional regulator TrmB
MTGSPQRQLGFGRSVREGLTEREGTVLETLVRLGSASAEDLAERSGLGVPELRQVLHRLAELGYAVMPSETGGTYRAVAQVGG